MASILIQTVSLSGAIQESINLRGSLILPAIIQESDYYSGSTDVIPSEKEQILYTEGKTLIDNIFVRPIPYAEVSNDYGGKTVTIGGR